MRLAFLLGLPPHTESVPHRVKTRNLHQGNWALVPPPAQYPARVIQVQTLASIQLFYLCPCVRKQDPFTERTQRPS